MVLNGLVGGVTQVLYVVLLLYLLLYVYAIAGIIFFSDNDPWNFKYVDFTMIVLLRVVTLDTWGDNFYTNYFGCSEFPGGVEPTYTNDESLADERMGGLTYCSTPKARPFTSVAFFLSFICFGSFGILSSIIGNMFMYFLMIFAHFGPSNDITSTSSIPIFFLLLLLLLPLLLSIHFVFIYI